MGEAPELLPEERATIHLRRWVLDVLSDYEVDMEIPRNDPELGTDIALMAAEILALSTRQAPKVKAGTLERIVWAAMVWASENRTTEAPPEYTDTGNSFAEREARAAVRRILSALEE